MILSVKYAALVLVHRRATNPLSASSPPSGKDLSHLLISCAATATKSAHRFPDYIETTMYTSPTHLTVHRNLLLQKLHAKDGQRLRYAHGCSVRRRRRRCLSKLGGMVAALGGDSWSYE